MLNALEVFFEALARVRRTATAAGRRVRADFLGTSNQRSADAPACTAALARAHGVADLVTETPGRLAYFDTLQAFRDADALLLLGTREAHYTPSRIYAALNSERPVVAVYHEDSPVTDLLRRFGRSPSVRLITYSDARPVHDSVELVAAALEEVVADPVYDAGAVDRGVLCEASACALAGRLSDVFRRVSAPPAVPA
jgi:hypothetical protein